MYMCVWILWVTSMEIVWLCDFLFTDCTFHFGISENVTNCRSVCVCLTHSPLLLQSGTGHVTQKNSVIAELYLFEMPRNSVTFWHVLYQNDGGNGTALFVSVLSVWHEAIFDVPAPSVCSFLHIYHFLPLWARLKGEISFMITDLGIAIVKNGDHFGNMEVDSLIYKTARVRHTFLTLFWHVSL